MKICLITSLFPEGGIVAGAEIQCKTLAEYFARQGHEVIFLAEKGKVAKAEKKQTYFRIYYASDETKSRLFAFKNAFFYLRQEKPDVIYIRNFKYLFFWYLICSALSIPIVYNTTHVDNCLPNKKIPADISLRLRIFISIKQFLNFQVLRFVSVVTNNKSHRALLAEKGVESITIYNSLKDSYHQNKTNRAKLVIWVANIKARKRPDLYLRLVQSIKRPDVDFIMIGNIQADKGKYEALIKETEKKCPNFKYIGKKSFTEVNQYMAKARVLVHTCEPEGFSNNFIQAWLNACPTISLSFDPDNVIKDNKIGFHSQAFEQLLQDTKKVLDSDDLAAEMGQRARDFAVQNFDPQKNSKKFLLLFSTILKSKKHED